MTELKPKQAKDIYIYIYIRAPHDTVEGDNDASGGSRGRIALAEC